MLGAPERRGHHGLRRLPPGPEVEGERPLAHQDLLAGDEGRPLGARAAREGGVPVDEVHRHLPAAEGEGREALVRAAERAAAADAIVNATSIGLGGPADALPTFRFHRGQVAADFVYGETAFARAAQDEGAAVVTGEQILVRQGALALTLWTGEQAPEAVMAAALRSAPHAR